MSTPPIIGEIKLNNIELRLEVERQYREETLYRNYYINKKRATKKSIWDLMNLNPVYLTLLMGLTNLFFKK